MKEPPSTAEPDLPKDDGSAGVPVHTQKPSPALVRLVVPPVVAGETTPDYVVEVNGQPVPVYTILADEPRPAHFGHETEYNAAGRLVGPQPGQPYYHFAAFAFEGAAHVTVTSPVPLDRVVIEPASLGIRAGAAVAERIHANA
jgi:hypothetical protein